MEPIVTAVSSSSTHSFSKTNRLFIRLVAGIGVAEDAHAGELIKHRSRASADSMIPNLRQVHLIHAELHEELRRAGFSVGPGEIGENVTTGGIDLLGLPTGARLHLGKTAIVEVTGLREPCRGLDKFSPGLMAAVIGRDEHGKKVYKCGIMGIVVCGGEVAPRDRIEVELPAPPYRRLEML